MERTARKVRFERHASQVIFDPATSSFVVTWAKFGKTYRERMAAVKDPLSWLPSVSSIATLYDRGVIQQNQIAFAAIAVGKALDAGDRDMLDTESARKAAELVRDISCMCKDPTSQSESRDLGQAMRSLVDEIAAVRLSETDLSEMDEKKSFETLRNAMQRCFETDGFLSWSPSSMRRKFMFCLKRHDRTPFIYTLVSLAFDVGACPLLSLSDRRSLRMVVANESGLSERMTPDTMSAFFRKAISMMRNARANGQTRVCNDVTQQQLADSVSSSI